MTQSDTSQEKRTMGPGALWGTNADIARFEEHLETHLGPIAGRHHLLVGDGRHVTLYFIDDNPAPGLTTVVTYCLTERGMEHPEQTNTLYYPEACLILPRSWPRDRQITADDEFSWPFFWLTLFASYQQDSGKILQVNHTLGGFKPGLPLNEKTPFYGHLITAPIGLPKEFWSFEMEEGRTVHFLLFFPLYKEELDGKLEHGSGWLYERLERHQVMPFLIPGRPNVVTDEVKESESDDSSSE